jgi:heptaprenyl diphosphate synthase
LVNLLDRLNLPLLDEHLSRVEVALGEAVRSDDPFLSEVAGHLVTAGGKRLRPALVIAAAAASSAASTASAGTSPPASASTHGSGISEDVIQGAASVELVHMGSMYHDDVIDAADSRRGVPSVNSLWGNLVAIVAGDFLLARASGIAASLGTEVSGLLAATIARLCEGEVAELQYAYNPSRPESAYLTAITGKTASLMATSCRVGAVLAGADRGVVETLTRFGEAFGMAFQIWDDVLDLVGTDQGLGKPAGHDLVEGVYTLPVIRALAVPSVGPELHSLLGTRLDTPTRDKARDIIRSTDALLASVVEARRFADQADETLTGLPTDPVVDSLRRLGHCLLDQLDVTQLTA